jgi:uncharacterized membrane protein YfcA
LGLPLLLRAGNNLVETQLLILCAMLPQNLFACWRLRRSIDYREVALPAMIRILGLPIGVAGLVVLMGQPKQTISQLVGLIILLAIFSQFFAGIQWKNARRLHWLILTFGGSGFLQGLTGTGGPPMVLWVYGQRFPVDRARAFLFASYVICFVPQLSLLLWKFGEIAFLPILTASMAIPAVLVGSEIGLRIGSKLGDRWLRPLTYCVLILIALIAVIEPLFEG